MSDPKRIHRGTQGRRAVVLGGGLAGMLAAAALRGLADDIRVVENDELPESPAPRRGLPQAGHLHMMWSGGVHAAERLLPGVTESWLAAGARRIPIPTGMVGFSSQGWFRRWQRETHFLIACSRDLLDSVVRELVLADHRVRVLPRTRAEGLVGTASRVTGVRVREAGGRVRVLEADLVIDATGRGSRAPRYLAELGVTPPPERTVDPGMVYASRVFRAPEGADEFPVLTVQADARSGRPGQNATLLPIEGDRWLVTATGTRGGEPTGRAEDFAAFARGLRHPFIGDVISGLEPLSDVRLNRSTRNHRRFFERMREWPERFVVIGDAVACFNPVYGHGMSVAAQSALALREQATAGGILAPRFARRVQAAVARPVSVAWDLALGQDVFYPGVEGGAPTVRDRVLARYVDRLIKTSTGSFLMTREFTDVTSLQSPLSSLVGPRVLLAAAVGPHHPPLDGPPLTRRERALLAAAGAGTPGAAGAATAAELS
ncbi:FAD-dependent oxidoreductase [Streptomyces sp. CAU 1734]|uniref:FAD-dependent oxidoreductase n=1 Tax=Streptomyces sp. CAU 1734 TaxID=3140360 RepID=UPI0032618678